jgi:fructokinase
MGYDKKPLIVALGEVLWDVFPDGARLGGAPSNFAVHCAALGAQGILLSCVGDDALGRDAVLALSQHNVDTQWIQKDRTRSTGTVPVTLCDGQPSYEIVEDVAWDHIVWQQEFEALAKSANAICFGTLSQRSLDSRKTIQLFADATKQDCLRVLDVNFRQHYHSADVVKHSLALASVVKLNDDEVPILRGYIGGDEDLDEFLKGLLKRFALDLVVLTLGADGCRIFSHGQVVTVAGVSQQVANTVGAGDAFTAAFVGHYLNGDDLEVCAGRANALGGFVTTQDSGTPYLPSEFRIWSDNANR